MSKSDTKALRETTNAEKARTLAQQQTWESQAAPERAAAQQRANSLQSSLVPRMENLADTGGVDFKNAQSTLDPALRAKLAGFNQNQMVTGGYTPQDAANIRARSGSANAAVFERLNSRLANASRTSGGYSPGMGAVSAKLGRQASQEAATNSRENEIAIAQGIREGKVSGAQALQSLANFEAQNKMQGQELGQRGKLAGIGGLEEMYKLALDEKGNIDVNRLKMMGLTGDEIAQIMQSQKYLSSTPGVFDNILRGINTGVGVASSVTGLPGIGRAPVGGVPGVPVPNPGPPNMSGIGRP